MQSPSTVNASARRMMKRAEDDGYRPVPYDFVQEWYPYSNQNAAMKIVADLATNEHAVEVLDMARELLEWREASRARKATSE